MNGKMNFIVIGAGAIGTYIGGSLLASGNNVTFVERAEAIPRLLAAGMTIEKADGTALRLESVEVVATVAEALTLRKADAIVFAVKSFNTEDVLAGLTDVRDALPPFIALQNGVENEAKIAAFVGDDRTIPVSVCTAIARSDRGAIQVSKLRGIGIFSGHPLSGRIYEAFKAADLKPALLADGEGMKWSKMISNLLSNAASAILNMTPAEVYRDVDAYELERKQILETVAVMRAYGISVVDIPGVPVRLLTWAIENLPGALARPIFSKAVGGGRGAKMPSFYLDLHSGSKENEVEYLNGAVVRYAAAKGLNVPVNAMYYETLIAMTNGELSKLAFDHDPVKLVSERLNVVR